MEKSLPVVLPDVFSPDRAVVMGLGEGGPQGGEPGSPGHMASGAYTFPRGDVISVHLAEGGCVGLVCAYSVVSDSL